MMTRIGVAGTRGDRKATSYSNFSASPLLISHPTTPPAAKTFHRGQRLWTSDLPTPSLFQAYPADHRRAPTVLASCPEYPFSCAYLSAHYRYTLSFVGMHFRSI